MLPMMPMLAIPLACLACLDRDCLVLLFGVFVGYCLIASPVETYFSLIGSGLKCDFFLTRGLSEAQSEKLRVLLNSRKEDEAAKLLAEWKNITPINAQKAISILTRYVKKS